MEETKSSYQLPKQQAERVVKKFWSPRRKEALVGWLFLMPEIVGMLMLNVFALGFSLYLSFTDWDLLSGVSGIKFAGLQKLHSFISRPDDMEGIIQQLGVYGVNRAIADCDCACASGCYS